MAINKTTSFSRFSAPETSIVKPATQPTKQFWHSMGPAEEGVSSNIKLEGSTNPVKDMANWLVNFNRQAARQPTKQVANLDYSIHNTHEQAPIRQLQQLSHPAVFLRQKPWNILRNTHFYNKSHGIFLETRVFTTKNPPTPQNLHFYEEKSAAPSATRGRSRDQRSRRPKRTLGSGLYREKHQ